MQNLTIQQIDVTQVELVADLFDKYRIFYEQGSDLELAKKYLTARLNNKEAIIFVATITENETIIPVGFTLLYAKFSSVGAKTNWHIGDLYVARNFRKKGLGEKLLNTAIEFAKKDNASFISLNTANDNYNAQSLYETIGFTKRRPPNPGYWHYKYDL